MLKREVNNGGFSQYLYNSSGKYAKEAVEALKPLVQIIRLPC